MIKLLRSRMVFAIPLISALVISVILIQTSPQSIGPAGILLVFLLLYVFFASCLFIVLWAGESGLRRVLGEDRVRKLPKWQLEVRRSYYIASVIAFVPVALLAMQSLGQLQLRDVFLVVILAGLVSFYVLRISR